MPIRIRASDRLHVAPDEVHVIGLQHDPALIARPDLQVVHAVEAAQKGALAASRRADERGDAPIGYRHVQILERVVFAVPEVEPLDRRLDLGRRRRPRVVGREPRARHDDALLEHTRFGSRTGFWNWLSRHGRVRMEGFEQSTRSSRYDLTIGR